MADESSERTIFISALEHSAEMHCANLMAAVGKLAALQNAQTQADVEIKAPAVPAALKWIGFGGQRMEEAGCALLDNPISRAAMIYNVLGQLGYYKKLIRLATEYFENNRVDLVVVCDSPAFNFHIAKAAKQHNIPVLFYVAPQLWAWAPWRIKKLKRCCDRLACILPFEQDWFCKRGVDAQFVSNPLFDEMTLDLAANRKSYSDYSVQAPKVALLPGSRDHEIDTLWPPMLDIAFVLKKEHPKATFTACAPDEMKKAKLETFAGDLAKHGLDISYESNALIDVAKRSDFAIVASGSATLQVAAAGCPMAVMYQSSRLMWHVVGRWLVRTRFLSLPNILAKHELVPEFMPYFTAIEPIAWRVHRLLTAPQQMSRISLELTKLVKPLTERRASNVVAQMVMDMLQLSFG
ncbi:MAG: lipid-A-disaccharide synthase [Planctomycetaceae bacterium]|nr:lipid-A-disaccharide synthase [Planctomycetaceae bacterium]